MGHGDRIALDSQRKMQIQELKFSKKEKKV